MPTRYIARVGSQVVGAVPLYYLTDNSSNFLLCTTPEVVAAVVDKARDRGVVIASYVVEEVEA